MSSIGINTATTGQTPNDVYSQLQQLLKYPGNLKCADCKLQLHPRWASWSLGVLICIRCAGIHRSLGTHISKVKSIDLDSWSNDNLQQFIINGDNERVNTLYYENKLQLEEVTDLDLSVNDSLVQFIKNKYEAMKWVSDKKLSPAVVNVQEIMEERGIPAPTTHSVSSEPVSDKSIITSSPISIPQRDLTGVIHLKYINAIRQQNDNHRRNHKNHYNNNNKGFVKRSIYELYTTAITTTTTATKT